MLEICFFLLIIVTIGACITQYQQHRQHAAYVYAAGLSVHLLLFRGMPVFGIDHHYLLTYLVGGCIGSLVAIALQNLSDYTKFHMHLQVIALASMVINMAGGWAEFKGINPNFYTVASFALYFLLIGRLLRNGKRRGVCPDSGIFKRLRWPAV